MPTDVRTIRDGDRVMISETLEEGVVLRADLDVIRVRTDTGTIYQLPPILVDWRPPLDEPDVNRCYWYLPSSHDDQPWISIMTVGDKHIRQFWRRDQLPDRIWRVESDDAST